ncbi:MAG: ABC transporter ATP-binding protein [Alphaproteobacteria bacterium]|nr:ABC transporter ATP-binding protein [Alphaproteobacteria bacterium]
MLTVRQLTRPGLAPVDLDLADGACVAVTGPSGAGKTLFMRAIADLDPADGTVALDGVERASMPACDWRRRVTYVPAEAGWWADRVRPHYPDWPVAAALAERFLLPPDCGDWTVSRLSTGEKQRLALIRALVQTPRVLLLDEPTSGLDPDATEAVEAALTERLAAGVAILLVTHDAAQAARLATATIRFDNGRAAA